MGEKKIGKRRDEARGGGDEMEGQVDGRLNR